MQELLVLGVNLFTNILGITRVIVINLTRNPTNKRFNKLNDFIGDAF